MVQLSMIAIVLTSALSSLVAAKSCKRGGIYCGTDLLRRGDYITKINTNLRARNLPTSDIYVKQSLWACVEHGDIQLIQFCASGCIGGDSKDDYCTGSSKPAGKRDEIEDDDDDDVEVDFVERDVPVEWVA
ncbi:hypothetical protein SBOR_8673 [Sclerotinia borealis F-4128]|uniref:Uncharacterized protein n=1 Tax=Sclerotinia borealis (strain F-4128) TaxID=1432307 RepID=W9C8S6_SCLBF|nr:hypothetical protein SBOR_8673 [Sclerotinia borealis F-4128]